MDRALIKGEIALRLMLESLFLVVLAGSCLLLGVPSRPFQLAGAALIAGSGWFVHHHHEATRRLVRQLRVV